MLHSPRKRSSKGGSLRDRQSSFFSSCPLPRIAIAAICLLISQLVILNVVVIVFQAKTNPNEVDPILPRKSAHLYSKNDLDAADGIFNGYPVYFRKDQKNVETVSHCVGENYQDSTSWQKRSCEFSDFFCFDTVKKDYVVFDKAENDRMYKHAETQQFIDISQSFLKRKDSKPNTVSVGGINLKWGDEISRLEWFPEIRILKDDESLSYYELPSNVVMIPFHSMNGGNPGHLVWDDFLPIYNLLKMYQLMNESTELMMMRYILKDPEGGSEKPRGLWASCDWTNEKTEVCKKMFKKFLPLMLGSKPTQRELATTETFDFQPKDKTSKSNLICAKHGVAGIGPLTDHGTSKLHGWEEGDYQTTQNHGRGGLLYEFRNFMLTNLGIPVELNHKPPFRIVFSEKSSSIGQRNFDFSGHKALLQKSFHPSYVSVESYVFSEMSIREQLEVASQASIFITSCGGGAVTSMFMPRGSSVIMYYLEDGGAIGNKLTGKPARLDWDLFNNMAYLKVHWLPAGTMSKEYDVKALLLLIQHELEGLIRERSYDHFFS
mmetsp:Transcript_14027/g.35293  ORF Transcript_14027/g.35293 Transcript_14027/m.35293 type:complete len:547 (+) Transcript_14027:158-1798(+)